MEQERRQTPSADRRQMPRGGRRATDQPGRHPRVIVADGYEAARRACMRYLDHFSFDVASADDGAAAMSEIRINTPAVILMDSHLSDQESRERLALESRSRGIPLIVLTDTPADVSDPRMTRLGAVAVLVKPFP